MTKKSIQIHLIFFFLLPMAIHAQTFLGFKAGLLTTPSIVYTDVKYSNSNIDFKPSFAVSGMIKRQVVKYFTIGTNINYDFYKADFKSSWYNPDGESGSKEATYEFGFLGLYLYPQFNFGKTVQFFFNFGFYYGVLTNSSVKVAGEESHAKDDIMSSVIGLASEIGLQYAINQNWQVFLDISGKRVQSLVIDNGLQAQYDLTLSFGFFFKISKGKNNTE